MSTRKLQYVDIFCIDRYIAVSICIADPYSQPYFSVGLCHHSGWLTIITSNKLQSTHITPHTTYNYMRKTWVAKWGTSKISSTKKFRTACSDKQPWKELVLCPAELALMHKHCLVTMLEFLGLGSVIQPKYWLANQNRGVA